MKRLAVIGGGSWGTALAVVLAPRFEQIKLWVYESDLSARMTQARENDVYLPGISIPTNLVITSDLAEALDGAQIVLSVMPSHLARNLYRQMLPFLHDSMVFVSATKGLENGSLLRVTEVIREVLQPVFHPRVAVISGPTFAREVACFEPTALVVASEDEPLAAIVQSAFSGPTFRLYTSSDPTGVEVGGSIKNVVAIGAGVLSGMGLGHNVTAALITRGLAEMNRLALAMGGKPQTLAGLAGLGDLVLTCTGDLSRNRTVGVELAHGRKLEEIVNSMKMVAEGIKTTNAAVDLAKRHGVEMPISEQMYQMLHYGVSPRDAIQRLMERSLKGE
ncbi:MAG TPA: NAD(P)H-dependent glycerol-3-phosphate dehydrogenase [Candidatus Sulfopaludibacter sp.]|jgi:glycerol-3-phosphate dehydrogenase (NAD(P)+)|nr:NAD(P)H-dependent glycerol-3-phosphate dehydrogenase [Candidatus Sulfopaludibacter sp.]